MFRDLKTSLASHAPIIQATNPRRVVVARARTMSAYVDSRGLVRSMPERIPLVKTRILSVVRIVLF